MLSKALAATRANAIRLLEDARLLYLHGRYPSSVALSIFAIEEVGKFRLAEDIKAGTPPKRWSHHKKQTAVSVMHTSDLWLSLSAEGQRGIEELFARRLSELRAQPFEETLKKPPRPHTETSDRINEIFIEAILRRKEKLLQARYMVRTGTGETNKTRELALYVDFTHQETVTQDPRTLAEADASEWLLQADMAVTWIGWAE